MVPGVAGFTLRLAADDLGGGTAVSCSRCSTVAASVATISRKRSTRSEWKCGSETASSSRHRFFSAIGRLAHPGVGTRKESLGDEGDAFAGGDHAGEVIEVQGGGAETGVNPAFRQISWVQMRPESAS